MDDAEEYYRKKYIEVQDKLADPKVGKKIDDYLKKISKLVDCDVEINFMILPHVDNYQDIQDSDDYQIPEITTMPLGEVLTHLNKEKDMDLEVYIDPIYLKSGLNAIIDILISTTDNKMIVVPIANNKKIN